MFIQFNNISFHVSGSVRSLGADNITFIICINNSIFKMTKRIQDYVKYTSKELMEYVASPASCVKQTNSLLHMNLAPYGIVNVRKSIANVIAQKKIGRYDPELKGIILDVKNIKIVGDKADIRFDDSSLHINIRADCFYFRPTVGSVVKGVVCHISSRQIGVIIYRVFSVSIRLKNRIDNSIELNTEIEFRIKNFDLENMLPYIEGELVAREVQNEDHSNEDSSENEDDAAEQHEDKCELLEFIEEIKNENELSANIYENDIIAPKLKKEKLQNNRKSEGSGVPAKKKKKAGD